MNVVEGGIGSALMYRARAVGSASISLVKLLGISLAFAEPEMARLWTSRSNSLFSCVCVSVCVFLSHRRA